MTDTTIHPKPPAAIVADIPCLSSPPDAPRLEPGEAVIVDLASLRPYGARTAEIGAITVNGVFQPVLRLNLERRPDDPRETAFWPLLKIVFTTRRAAPEGEPSP